MQKEPSNLPVSLERPNLLENPIRIAGLVMTLFELQSVSKDSQLYAALVNIRNAVQEGQTEIVPDLCTEFVSLAHGFAPEDVHGVSLAAQAVVYLSQGKYKEAVATYVGSIAKFKISDQSESIKANSAAAWLGRGYADMLIGRLSWAEFSLLCARDYYFDATKIDPAYASYLTFSIALLTELDKL